MSIKLRDFKEPLGEDPRTLEKAVPAWAMDFRAGGGFRLRRPLLQGRYRVDGNVVEVAPTGHVLNVALVDRPADVLRSAYVLAEKVLDLLAVEAFQVGRLEDPLREHCVWWRQGGLTTLRCVDTARLAFETKAAARVLKPDGTERPQAPRPPQRWHASHAYFRRSQNTDNLDDSYRYLYLALESLLSELYPWRRDRSENAWLQDALRNVCEGYQVDLNDFLIAPTSNPYKRFIKEQYRAQRCALFHAKSGETPRTPGAPDRDELATATRKIGSLYVRLAALGTGAGFAGSAITYAAFEGMVDRFATSSLYVSPAADFEPDQCLPTPVVLEKRAYGQPGVHQLVGAWRAADIRSAGPILLRSGSAERNGEELTDGFSSRDRIVTDGVDILQCVVQVEMNNTQNLREWFL